MRTLKHWALALGVAWSLPGVAEPVAATVTVPGGVYQPFYPASPQEASIAVSAFRMDRTPVTNAQFLDFVRQHPEWQRDRVSRLFADGGYLTYWQSATELGERAGMDRPVTNVSWHAAQAYCQARGARLPTEDEWEYAAAASETRANGKNDPVWRQRVLQWYTQPMPEQLPAVGQGTPNFFGIYDLHGVVWEWVLDFNNNLIAVDSRSGKDTDKTAFCGAGAQLASEKDDYASFMRIAFRSSLKANYTTSNLGFRCVQEIR